MDFTIDFETCSMSANAAVMQVAVVPWMRDNDVDPFFNEHVKPYVGYVDLRSCVVDGFDFDKDTLKWWSERSVVAKEAVTRGEPKPIDSVLIEVLNYIRRYREDYNLKSICVWCQGMDFDIAILRNLCVKYGVILEEDIPHTQFRDCRTVIMEAAVFAARRKDDRGEDPDGIALSGQILAGSYDVYKMFEPLPERYATGSDVHDALYDALRSSWNTWQALRQKLKCPRITAGRN